MDWRWKLLIGIEGALVIAACFNGLVQGYRIKLFNEEQGLGRMSMWWHLPDLPRLLTFIARTSNREAKGQAINLLMDAAIAVLVFIITCWLFSISRDWLGM